MLLTTPAALVHLLTSTGCSINKQLIPVTCGDTDKHSDAPAGLQQSNPVAMLPDRILPCWQTTHLDAPVHLSMKPAPRETATHLLDAETHKDRVAGICTADHLP